MTGPINVLCVLLPLRIVSVLNLREHHMARARRAKLHRRTAHILLGQACPTPPTGLLRITLTRIAPRDLDGHENLPAGFKGVVDGVADWLKVDDSDKRLTFAYAQRTGKPKEYAAEVVVEWAA